MKTTIRLGLATAAHLYLVEVSDAAGAISWIEVSATNRTQAGSIAKRAGYTVRSMSMEG